MIDHSVNGRPVLLDHNGNPIRGNRGRPDGAARPAGIALPHGWGFLARYQGASNTYWHDRFDEAMRHSRKDAEAMRRDCYLMSLLQERTLAVCNLNWHLETPDERDKFQTQVKDGLTRLIKGIPFFRRMLLWWLNALWYGRNGVQVEWEWEEFLDGPQGHTRPRKGLTIAEAWEVNGDKIGHQEDHTPYILVNSAKVYELPNAEIVTTTLGRGLALRGTWKNRFIIHRHLQEDADFFAPDTAEAIHGVGIRSKVFWTNFLRMEWLGNISDFFDKIGLGVTVWKYQMGNDNAYRAVKQAALDHSSRAHIFVPVSPDGGKDAGTSVERIEVPTSGSDALGKLIEMCDRYIERYVVGQEGSSRGSSSGIGNEASAEFMMDTKGQITKLDANLLAETITGSKRHAGMLNTMLRWTYPEADFPVKFVFDVENPQSDKKVQNGKTIVDMGIAIKADEMRASAGFSKPAEGDELVKNPQEQQQGGMPGMPGAAGGMPGMGGSPGTTPPTAGDPMAAMGAAGTPASGEGDFLGGLQSDAGTDAGVSGGPGSATAGGDFLSSLQQSRRGQVLQYDRASALHQSPAEILQHIEQEIMRRRGPEPGSLPLIGDEIDLPDEDMDPFLPVRDAAGVVRYARRSPLRYADTLHYAWENKGQVGTTSTGLELYRWVNTDTGERRRQHSEPGTGAESRAEVSEKVQVGRRLKAEEEAKKPSEVLVSTSAGDRVGAFLTDNLPGAKPEHLPVLIGLPSGANLSVYHYNRDPYPGRSPEKQILETVSLSVSHPMIDDMSRTIELRGDGDLVMHNNAFFAKKAFRGGGFGLRVFAGEVQACQAAGIDRIETTAGRGGVMNGYYTWPRMGYNATLEDDWVEKLSNGNSRARMRAAMVREAIKRGMQPEEAKQQAKSGAFNKEIARRVKTVQDAKPRTVLDVMALGVEGMSVWSGCGYMADMSFDLTPGSRSMQTLNAYLQARGLQPIADPSPEVMQRAEQSRKQRKSRAAEKLREIQLQQQAKRVEQEQANERFRQASAEIRTRFEGYAREIGLDLDKLRTIASERNLHPARYGIDIQGLTNLQVAEKAYESAYELMVFERHYSILTDPALRRTREEAVREIDPDGTLYGPGIHSEARRQSMNARDKDPVRCTQRAYRAARSYFVANMNALRQAWASQPESVHRRADELYRQAIQERLDQPNVQYGSDDPLAILKRAYTQAITENNSSPQGESPPSQTASQPHRKLLAAVQYLRVHGHEDKARELLARFKRG